jgi:phosphoribosylformylglycinamidine synthase
VVGGNVSLYNESRGSDIDPTPVVGLLGVVDRLERRPPGVRLVEGGRVLLLGTRTSQLDLPVEVDLPGVGAVADLVRSAVLDGLLAGAHDVSDGGLAAAVGEMVARSGIGARLDSLEGPGELFTEGPGRVLACVVGPAVDQLVERCRAAGVAVAEMGPSGGDRLTIAGPADVLVDLPVEVVVRAYADALPDTMAAGATH